MLKYCYDPVLTCDELYVSLYFCIMFETSEYLYLLTKGCLVFCIETCI